MRLLVVCESPPTLDAGAANGSTLIPAQVLPRLPEDVQIDLLWYDDRDAAPAPAVLERCRSAVGLPVRSPRTALAAQVATTLPRATWQRAGGDRVVAQKAVEVDAVYLHGLHTFSVAASLPRPFLAHEVDPWSHYWAQRASEGRGARALYDLDQSRRARRLERSVNRAAARHVVVNEADAVRLSQELGGPVHAVPNGVDLARLSPGDPDAVDPDLLVFVGTLDYPPNVAAVTELCREVLPRVRSARPETRLVVAGRRPVPEVLALSGPGVEVVGQVDDVRDLYTRAAAAVYPGSLGRGTKNTVLEALACGCPVVASPQAARGATAGEHLLLGDGPDELARHVVALLDDPARRRSAGRAAARAAQQTPGWDEVAARYADLLHATAASAPDRRLT